ncbi:MAG: aspartate kinase [Syntrophales bacterium]
MLTVEKIGGTSMSRFQDVLNNIIIGKRGRKDLFNRIFVVSAYNNVTNWLLEHKKTGEPGIYAQFAEQTDYHGPLEELVERLIEINGTFADIGLDLAAAEAYVRERISKTKITLDSLAHVLSSGYLDKQSILLAAREILASLGEAHSAWNSVNILKHNGIRAILVDLSGARDSQFLTIDERVRKSFRGIDFSKAVTVATGYAKGTEGIMREFDRGYSEVTFSKIAVAVKADEAVIHKEFHLSSADPKVVGAGKSVVVNFTNYDVADQLADIGMEAIHPKASKPLENAGINLRIKNTFEPDHPGTLISKDYVGRESRVEIIAGTDKVVIVEIYDPSMVGQVGFDMRIMELFTKYNVSYVVKTTNANSISMVIWEKDKDKGLIKELKEKYQSVTVKNVAVVCAIGTNFAKPGVLAKAANALAANRINVECISQSLRQTNMQFVIRREAFEKAIIALNDALCVDRS